MKIHQLPLGARFRHQGEEYVKTGPMLGTGKDGQKMFPRHLVLEPLDPPAPVPEPARTLPRDAVLQAFAAFCAECRGLVADDDQAALERAQQLFLRALD